MDSTVIAVLSLGCIFGGTLIGLCLRRVIPVEHLSSESKDTVKAAAGTISMMAALVIGLLVSSAKGQFDATTNAVVHGGAKIIMLDRALAGYGSEAKEVREQLRTTVEASIVLLWPEENVREGLGKFEKAAPIEGLARKVRGLKPQTEGQRAVQEQALEICGELLMSRWLQIEQAQTSLPAPFLAILLFWLMMLYMGFGLFAPRNWTVVAAMFVGALSLATALFLILEMSRPMDGIIKVPSAPMRKALEYLGQAP